MVLEVSVSWLKHACSDLVSTFQLLASRSTRRLKVLERSVIYLPCPLLLSRKANVVQMARKMDFSVVGLPHYTIWHLYEPSVDDIKHMEVSDIHQVWQENRNDG